jgi:CRP-like cAMP-binding protein
MELLARTNRPERLTAVGLSARQRVIGNRLLNRLPENEMARLMPLFERVEITPRQILHHRNLPMEHVYFVERGLVSVMAKTTDREWVEVWLIGSDGSTGIPVVLGDTRPSHRRVVQIGGSALRISAEVFHNLLQVSEPLREILLDYVEVVLLQTSQSGACNAQHAVKQRLARWLLLARDALGSSLMPVPHEMLGRLIGVRRATITDCLNDFEAHAAIRTARRLIEVTDAPLLESLSCDCYRIIKHERLRLLGW